MKTMKRVQLIPLVIGVALLLGGCANSKKVAVNAITPVVDSLDDMILRMPLKQVEKSLPGTLGLVENLLKSSPDNYDLLVVAAKGFTAHAQIVEDDDREKATELYRKGRDYGLRALELHPGFAEAKANGAPLRDAVKEVNEDKYIECLLWTGLAWGLDIMLNIDDPMILVNITDVRAIMKQVESIDDSYFYGMTHVFFGSYYAILPSIFGGGPENITPEFDRAFEISDNKFLLAHVFYSRYYATLIKDEELFESELNMVLDAPANILPATRFLNDLAKKKAQRLLDTKEKLFF